jgi:hypothetical protein
MATASTAYGQFNPSAVDPYPIETKLAELATTSPASAQTMLDTYRLQRQAAGSQYTDQLEQQRQFAHEQLASQIAKNKVDAAQGFLKEPGGLAFASSSPEFSGYLGHADPNVVGGLINQQTRLQDATVAEKGGAGVASITNAGFQPSQAQVTALTGIAGPQGDPVTTTNAKIAAAAKLGAASIGAANRQGPKINVPYKAGVDSDGNPIMGTIPVPANASPAEIQQRKSEAENIYRQFYPPGPGVSGVTPPGGDDSTYAAKPPLTSLGVVGAPSKPPATQTNVPPAPVSGARTDVPTSKAIITDPAVQAKARPTLALFPPDVRTQILRNAPGGILPLVPTKGGSVGFVGKNGQTYILPPPPPGSK